jgi:hypothetical protein
MSFLVTCPSSQLHTGTAIHLGLSAREQRYYYHAIFSNFMLLISWQLAKWTAEVDKEQPDSIIDADSID